MSRLGKMHIEIPKGVEIKTSGDQIHFKGPKGELRYELPKGISTKIENQKLQVICSDEKDDTLNRFHGLYRSLCKNALIGVSQGFEKKLTMIGVGYRAALKGNAVDLKIGTSHPVEVPIPKGIQVNIDKGIDIVITGADRKVLGQFAADLRGKKPPEPYKGKGIRYVGEYVRKKAGKAAAAAAKGTGGPAK
jgi:large subunit ribosomal protein L6